MWSRIITRAALAAAVILESGCGNGAASERAASTSAAKVASPNQQPSVDVCALLTADEIRAATGAKVVDAKAEAHGAMGTCNYQAADQILPVVSVILYPGMPTVASSTEMAAWRSKQGTSWGDIKIIIEPVEGLGVPAIRNEVEGAGLVTIEVAAKGMLLNVTTATLEQSKALATKAMARLK